MREVYHSTLDSRLSSILLGGLKTLKQQIAEGTTKPEIAEGIAGGPNEYKPKRWDTLYFHLRQPYNNGSWISILVDEETAVVANYFLGNNDFEKSKMTLTKYLRRIGEHKGYVHPITALPLKEGIEPMVVEFCGDNKVLKTYRPEILVEKPILTPKEFHRINIGSDYNKEDGPIPARFIIPLMKRRVKNCLSILLESC